MIDLLSYCANEKFSINVSFCCSQQFIIMSQSQYMVKLDLRPFYSVEFYWLYTTAAFTQIMYFILVMIIILYYRKTLLIQGLRDILSVL